MPLPTSAREGHNAFGLAISRDGPTGLSTSITELIVKVELIATALTLCLASGAVIAQQSIVDALDLIEIQQFQNEHGGDTDGPDRFSRPASSNTLVPSRIGRRQDLVYRSFCGGGAGMEWTRSEPSTAALGQTGTIQAGLPGSGSLLIADLAGESRVVRKVP